MEKLSVVVPVYNVYPYLRECLDSIINQTYKNLEIIIVNDASLYKEDDEICREYVAKDERIKYIVHDENKGLGGARNTGIDNATGKYIAFVDSDDYINSKDLYLKVIEKFKTKKINFVSYGVTRFSETKQSKLKLSERKLRIPKIIDSKLKISELAWNKVFLLEDLKNKIYFEEKLKYEDFIFWYKYVIITKPIGYYINLNGYMYRIREDSIMGNHENMKERFTAFNIVYEFIKSKGYEKEYKNHFVKWIEYPENYTFFTKEIKKIYSEEAKKFINKIKLSGDDVRELLDFKFYIMFIDEDIIDLYMDTLKPWKKLKYKIVWPNNLLYKIKREFINNIKKIKQ